ncbi:patatin-like phospholipase family protein, partial [Pseudomonas sp. KCJK8993]|uniref:patatin-like phospholipase family protein n=1 Tax=Pseudomonas sp. KCJK8993 TaxID=3344565 RepID=UPI0039062EEA
MTPADTPYQIEQQRIRFRRLNLQQSATQQPPLENWGLALSGGGIRSATFGLGVLQAMARAPAPDTHQANPEQPPANAEERSLLSRFDYLSTVSGGGYIGSFFSRLFLPGRLRPADSRDPVGQAAR